ncbi:MAG: hypothetical protein A3F31_03610 [Candidatus Levybacteria bacterium RIFCSPHIGHO2_12_FULL_38_12]|nr:MAG: hypothetical protein A3F31_03610 [Candidatus Levybacteria bacterium RIFCSPHIGHO2_12_FULL_38_12]OGH43686.1 MAG: hypothetical protein A3J14_03780 [Candidatus Levybacteria bacterium RIFCSPLOWO2_02_FULL_37_18]
MISFIKFTVKFHQSIVERVSQNSFDFIKVEFVTRSVENFVLDKKFADISISITTGGKKLKSFLHILGSFFINLYFLINVYITKSCLIGPFSAAKFLAITPLYIFGKIINIILRLIKGHT